MNLETERLILRYWRESDAKDLFREAKDPRIGPMAGWPPHASEKESLDIIKNVLSKPYSYAVVLKTTNKVIGSISLFIGEDSSKEIWDDEGEIGYWIGFSHWGKGLIPEATNEFIRYSFEELNLEKLWCGYFDGNNNSKRVQEKCGFTYHHTKKNVPWPLIDEIKTEHITYLSKASWLNEKKSTN